MEPIFDTTKNKKRAVGQKLSLIARQLRLSFDQGVEMKGLTRAKWTLIAAVSRNPGATQRIIAQVLEVSEITEADPNSCIWSHHASSSWKRGDWDCTVEADCELRSTAEDFILTESLTARRGEEVIFERTTESRINRDLV